MGLLLLLLLLLRLLLLLGRRLLLLLAADQVGGRQMVEDAHWKIAPLCGVGGNVLEAEALEVVEAEGGALRHEALQEPLPFSVVEIAIQSDKKCSK